MGKNEIIYRLKTSTANDIRFHLEECNNNFLPPLNEKVNINEYAKKIFEKAITFEAWKEKTLIGLIAAYFNNTSSSVFITNVSVTKKHMGSGVASQLLHNCIEYARHKRFNEIQLEVGCENIQAQNFYKKHNFIHCDIKKDTMIRKLELNK